MTIYSQLYKLKQIKNVSDGSIVNILARYKAKIKTGTKLNNACKNLTVEGEQKMERLNKQDMVKKLMTNQMIKKQQQVTINIFIKRNIIYSILKRSAEMS